jgi:DNA (cytosine-5)-methyltransferase 1
MKKNKELISLSFFSGCLGLDLGLEKAGIHQILACDFDKNCRNTIQSNKPNLPIISDISKYEANDIRKISGLKKGQFPTLIVGGPPCQAFSTAGKRQSFKDPRGNVFLKYIQLIDDLQPEYAVIENVRGLLSASLLHRPIDERTNRHPPLSNDELPGSALYFVLKWLKKIGYEVSFNLYNSANFGVPQVRERVILIASKNGVRVPYLQPTHSDDKSFGLKKWVTFKEAVSGLKEKDMNYVNYSEDRLKYFRLLTSGQYWKHLPTEKLIKEALGKSYTAGGGKTGFLRRLAWDKPSPTLVTSPIMPATDLAHPEKERPLSIQEYKRIQQFPDNWIIEGKLVDQYKQVGNAVPVGLGEALGKTLINNINGSVINDEIFKNFKYSRYKNTDEITWLKYFNSEKNKLKNKQIEFKF